MPSVFPIFRIAFNSLTFGGFPPMMILLQRKFISKGFSIVFSVFSSQKIGRIRFPFFYFLPYPAVAARQSARCCTAGRIIFSPFFLFSWKSVSIRWHSFLLSVFGKQPGLSKKPRRNFRKHCNFQKKSV